MIIRKLIFLFLISMSCSIVTTGAQGDSLEIVIHQEKDLFQKTLHIISYIEQTIGVSPKRTMAYQTKALSYFDEANFPNKKLVAKIWATLIHRSEGKLELALKENLEVIEILENHSTPSSFSQILLSKMLGYLGQLYNRSHYYEPVLGYLFKGLAIAESEHFIEGQAMALNALAVLYAEGYEDYELAIEYSERVLPLIQQTENDYGTMILMDNLATYYTQLGDWDKSLPLHLEAIQLAEEMNRTPYLGDFYKNIGLNYLEQNDIQKAEKFGQKALGVQSESRNEHLLAYVYHLLGKCKQQQKDWFASVQYFEQALGVAKKGRDFRFISELLNDYGHSSVHNNQPNKANGYFTEAIAYKDSVYQAFKIKQVLELETRHRIQDIEKEKALLEQEKTLQTKIIKGQKRQLWLIGSLGILGIISSLIFFFQKKKLDNSYQTLVQKNRDLISIEQKISPIIKTAPINQALKEKIRIALLESKLYLDPNITVHKLAKRLDSNTTYVSKTINEGFGKNFSSLISEYRIKEALQALEAGNYEQYTIESLGNQAGFKSRTAFINAFKKYTGVTPSFYIKQLIKQEK